MRRNVSVVLAMIAVVACAKSEAPATDSTAAASAAALGPDSASMPGAMIHIAVRDAGGRDLGMLMLTESAGGLTLAGTLRGLPPGTHAIHVHTTGQCAAPFESAGPHWNPLSKQHGTLNPLGPHLGDMPNFTVGADSSAALNVSTAGGTLRGADALLDADGASAVVHAGADDMKSDPAGNTGEKIACGAISGT